MLERKKNKDVFCKLIEDFYEIEHDKVDILEREMNIFDEMAEFFLRVEDAYEKEDAMQPDHDYFEATIKDLKELFYANLSRRTNLDK